MTTFTEGCPRGLRRPRGRPGLPRSCKAIRSLCIIGLFLYAGCATTSAPRPPREPVWIPDAHAIPRVIVYGALDDLLPVYDETPALEKFLYGPDPGRFGMGLLRNPQGLTLVGSRVFVCDQGYPDTFAVDLATGRSTNWGDADHRPRCPVDVTVDGDGRVYVADTTLRAVLVYAADERFIAELRPTGGGPDSFRPCSVLVHKSILYVGNLAARRVDRFDVLREAWLPPWAPSGEELRLIAPTGISTGPDGDLLIADTVQGVIHRVTTEGRWLIPIGTPGRGPGQFIRPKQVRCTASRLIFVSDAGRQSVLAFDADGHFLFEISGDAGDGRGFSLPMGLVTVNPGDLPLLSKRLAEHPEAASDECVVVSDTLGGRSLVVLGVVTRAPEGRKDAR